MDHLFVDQIIFCEIMRFGDIIGAIPIYPIRHAWSIRKSCLFEDIGPRQEHIPRIVVNWASYQRSSCPVSNNLVQSTLRLGSYPSRISCLPFRIHSRLYRKLLFSRKQWSILLKRFRPKFSWPIIDMVDWAGLNRMSLICSPYVLSMLFPVYNPIRMIMEYYSIHTLV